MTNLRKAPNSKLQHPENTQAPSSKTLLKNWMHQFACTVRLHSTPGAHGVTRPTSLLKFGASLELGCWCLDFFEL